MTAYPYRYRRKGKLSNRDALIITVIVIVAAGAASGHKTASKAGRDAGADVPALVTGSGDLGTPAGWARALLAADSLPVTACNMGAVTAWERAEGGGFGNQAAYNPLNVNPGPGAGWPGRPAIGAWAFPDPQTGLRYTVSTLGNGYYGGILAALRAGNSAQAVCDAIMASPWAASRYYGTLTASC